MPDTLLLFDEAPVVIDESVMVRVFFNHPLVNLILNFFFQRSRIPLFHNFIFLLVQTKAVVKARRLSDTTLSLVREHFTPSKSDEIIDQVADERDKIMVVE